MISTIYYFILVFNLIGGSLIYAGYRDHYLVQKIIRTETIDKAFFSLAYSVVLLPFTILVVNKICGTIWGRRKAYFFIQRKVDNSWDSSIAQLLAFFLLALCSLATIYVLSNLGYVPIVEMIRGREINALRQSGSRYFQGNQYVKNLLMRTLTPYTSYFTYICFRLKRTKSWLFLSLYSIILSIIVLTYDFSKSPIITYMLGIYLIEVSLGNIKNNKKFYRLGFVSLLVICFFYFVMMRSDISSISLTSGPVGRILFSQIATLFLHFDAFPGEYPFLNGGSFNSWLSFIIPNAMGLRSGRVVMSIYNVTGIENNTAGVMNTVFVGEAYANFGTVGIIIAPIIFGTVIGVYSYFLTRIKKTPVSVLLCVQMTLQFITIIEGGFIDIFYSASVIFITIITIFIFLFMGKHNRKRATQLDVRESINTI